MLQRIIFELAPETAESQAVKDLLNELCLHGINYIFSGNDGPTCAASPSPDKHRLPDASSSLAEKPMPATALLQALALPSGDCLMLTDSVAGISCAKASGVPCIGYAPSGSVEDLSGAYALFEDFASIDITYLCRTHAHAVGYPAEILSTERLVVREFSEADFPALYAMCTEPSTASVMEEVLSDYETEREKHRAYIRNIYPLFDLALWGVYEKASGKLIGRAGFSLPEDDSNTFSLGYLIDVPYRRRGYAKELIPALLSYAKEQGYTKISARIKTGNTSSVKALEQCGFPYECKEDTGKGILTFSFILLHKAYLSVQSNALMYFATQKNPIQ